MRFDIYIYIYIVRLRVCLYLCARVIFVCMHFLVYGALEGRPKFYFPSKQAYIVYKISCMDCKRNE